MYLKRSRDTTKRTPSGVLFRLSWYRRIQLAFATWEFCRGAFHMLPKKRADMESAPTGLVRIVCLWVAVKIARRLLVGEGLAPP